MQLDALHSADPTPAPCRQVIIMISAVPTTCVPKACHWKPLSQAHLLLSSKPNRLELFLCLLHLHSTPTSCLGSYYAFVLKPCYILVSSFLVLLLPWRSSLDSTFTFCLTWDRSEKLSKRHCISCILFVLRLLWQQPLCLWILYVFFGHLVDCGIAGSVESSHVVRSSI